MTKKTFTNISKQWEKIVFMLLLSLMIIFGIFSCKKESEPVFTADFSFDYIDDNHVRFTNKSSGEYYWMVWDFGNGTTDTIVEKNEEPQVYYSLAGDYVVRLQITNYYGSSRSISKTVSIANDDLVVSFTAEIDPASPNYVVLTNTTPGTFDSFIWKYLDQEVADEMVHTAYFPIAGDYTIQLVITLNNTEFQDSQPVTIISDDPNYDPTLVWAEEFNYTGMPDPAKWNMETGGTGWGNNELQYYTDSETNAYVENGLLTITAREEAVGGRDYTSARITTQEKFDFKYGRIEARIKLPYGQGLWPAFWMLGTNINTAGWPACGEIDIMEMVGGTGGDNTCHATIHWDNDGEHAQYGLSHTLASGIFADDFHVFGVKWDAQEIKAYMDDVEYYVADITPDALSEFQNNFFIILNIAVGGNWPGPPNATTEFPQTMQVDWVRVYQN
ncbi:MAG TPA: family 16 glycosylhydrolase [Bacteroidales bacterium]|nr:family 16 glycosylhydrolase [Bacteroidales bacterium]